MRRPTVVLSLAMTLMAVGCSFGRPFVRPQPETLVLGKTTYEEVIRQVGEPAKTGTVIKNDHTLRTIRYSYTRGIQLTDMESQYINVRPLVAMDFFFLDDVLVGYHFTSAHPRDTTDFEDTKAYLLKKGRTTRAEVIELLGKPSGIYVYPMISRKTDTALVYFHLRPKTESTGFFSRGMRLRTIEKMVVVSFDTNDLVTDVEFGSGGQK